MSDKLHHTEGVAAAAYFAFYCLLHEMKNQGLLSPSQIARVFDSAIVALEGQAEAEFASVARRLLEQMLSGLVPGPSFQGHA